MINLYSDTQSRPTDGMRAAIASADVGDEQKGTDPTVNRLLKMVSTKLGKEAAIFMPSGTMCNAIAVASHCNRGEGVIAESTSHLIRYEAGGMSALSGTIPEFITGSSGQFYAGDVEAHFHPGSRYTPKTTLLCVEQTCNLAGGAVWGLEQIRDVGATAKKLGMNTHMDGARLLNAEVSAGIPAAEFSDQYDSVWIDFTKGLGAPMGAVLCGSEAFVNRAWQWKHRLGGAMRQAGMMAAGCIYALDHNVERLAVDHVNANLLNDGLKTIPAVKVRQDKVASNIVYFDIPGVKTSGVEMLNRLYARGLQIGIVGDGFRAVTYLNITRIDIENAVAILADTLKE